MLTANPEPYADYFDVILVGDGEELLSNFTDRLTEAKQQLGAGAGGWWKAPKTPQEHLRMPACTEGFPTMCTWMCAGP